MPTAAQRPVWNSITAAMMLALTTVPLILAFLFLADAGQHGAAHIALETATALLVTALACTLYAILGILRLSLATPPRREDG